MVSINCWINDNPIILKLTSILITILNKDRYYYEILLLKNYEGSDDMLTICFEKNPIHIRFATPNIRNAVRTIIFIKANCYKRVIQNINYNILEENKILDCVLIKQLGHEVIEHVDQKNENAKFIEAFSSNQVLFDMFIYMKLPLENFYKLFITSNYYSSKNNKNELDKLLKKTHRKHV